MTTNPFCTCDLMQPHERPCYACEGHQPCRRCGEPTYRSLCSDCARYIAGPPERYEDRMQDTDRADDAREINAENRRYRMP